ncbi:hephaestin-like protein 1a [Megalops cyprinoides]|uniref:hephaestin-like protein 1a n=1 Tax=Megalops cyprinoides TaxID=118141 RepID=UPI0018650AE2|nr:hephaestin-like protein 1a [Megalops cyprinoides]
MDQLNRRWILQLLTLYITFPINECITRTYYIGIKEERWNYAPSRKNLITGTPIAGDEHASVFLQQGPHRIGSVYKKALYKEFTDGSYNEEIVKPGWLGFLGPVLRAEVDDVIIVHLKNFASRPYSLHPHGVFYEKDSEGALYPDDTSGKLKWDDAVPPGGNYTYRWIVKPEYAPTDKDANCLTWVYHSHGDAPRDISSGLIGALLTCKKGTLSRASGHRSELNRTDVDRDFILMFSVVDENLSWYLEENIENFCSDSKSVDPDDEDFQESNKMHAINGYVFGNLPGMEMCLNQSVSWHLFGMGNEVDIHSAYFHGHTVLDRGHRADVLSLFPATFVTAEMIPRTTGKWLLSCQVNDHVQAGMQAFYQVSSCGEKHGPGEPPGGRVRQYYITAEEQLWNYAPLGIDTFDNLSLTTPESHSEVFFGRSGGRLGGTYRKAHYVEYTDDTFTTKKKRNAEEEHLGILGPIIRAERGDLVVVTFLNNASRGYSIQPHGLQYEKEYEGAMYEDDARRHGSLVRPGDRFTYKWRVTEGPSASDPACISYLYYSASDPVQDTSSGLIGPLLVCKKDTLDESGSRRDVDREFFLLFSVMDENLSWYLKENIQMFGNSNSDPENEEFQESNKMHAVNGFMYGNLPGLELCDGERVSWHMLGLGTEVDIHGVYFQGNTFQREGMTRDTLSLFPHTTVTVTMVPDNDGTFEVSCRTSDHYLGGMRQHYSVKRCQPRDVQHTSAALSIVQYFIAAEEVVWDYSPSRAWELEKHNASEESSPGNIFVGKGERQIGSKYKKVVYREYTDATFRTRKLRLPQEEHLEILGPIIRAEVGERVLVNFKNKASRPYSIHAHGVEIHNSHLLPVQPGSKKQYQWDVPKRAGPGPSDPNCISFAYYSTADFVKDTVSGLIGPLVICRKGTLDSSRLRSDVDREFALLFMVFDENESWYLEENVQTYLENANESLLTDDEFQESNKMHAINGKLYGNLGGLVMSEGEKTDWYLLGMGNEVDMHTVHFHAQSFIYKTDYAHRADVYDLFPGTFQTVELVAGNPGRWLLHCHVTDHIHAGMETTFTIKSKKGRSGPSSKAASGLKNTLFTLTSWDLGAAATLVSLVWFGLLPLAL